MGSPLLLPSGMAPNNLRLRETVKATYVESDVYDICHRLAAVDPSLHLIQLEDEGSRAWAVTELVHGVECLVKRYAELDARMIEDVQRMRRIPLMERVAIAQAELDKAEADEKQATLDRMYEEVGQKTLHRLERDGFVQRPVSYPKSPIRQRAGR